MIYFLINNNYHHVDFLGHQESLGDASYSVIEIPHFLDDGLAYPAVRAVHRYVPGTHGSALRQLSAMKAAMRRIDKDIVPCDGDVLFFYTEYEPLNGYLADKFKKAGARVFLIEDGGLGTYIPFRYVEGEKLRFKEIVKRLLYRHVSTVRSMQFVKLNGHVFPRIADASIDAVCLYNPVRIKRRIDVRLIKRPACPIMDLVPGRVVFLNEPIYEIYQDGPAYLKGLHIMLSSLAATYPEVLFKFHPRETAEWRGTIRKQVLSQLPSVSMISEDAPIELLVETYKPQVLASYFCSALLSLCERGIEPLYLFHLIPELASQPNFHETFVILKELGYAFVDSYDSIGAHYRSGITGAGRAFGAVSLAELVASK